MNTLRINELFTSIQGESTRAGLPCFFIRLAGCNLRCSYCDTPGALEIDSPDARIMHVDDILREAENSGSGLVEITGGEPLVQSDGVCMLAERLIQTGRFTILLETNGAFDTSYVPYEVIRIVDYKTPSSGESEKMFAPNFTHLRSVDEIKFVISDRNDYLFAKEKLRTFSIASQTSNILFSPVTDSLDGRELVEWILKDKLPVRLNLQIHKFLNLK